ncbi:MFS general substrate transporter [Dendrothele bispora CBS 962.96]|uniref:MFS general substrate transporter n=1 Tax=Dendrothele bispora (strain CBS 962.96) TaxID=1314807 RepID=A0A4S8LHG3_DENBC|nr:MFS general substrate transporter [Dendrothele bispora CBS 962.96]
MALPILRRRNESQHRPGSAVAPIEDVTTYDREQDPELILPKTSSLIIILLANMFMQISFFIVVASSNAYAQHLGGTATFSGVVIGIPTVFSGITLIPLSMLKWDRGGYKIPLHLCCFTLLFGHVLYSLAYRANFLYLILIGRCVNGIGFSMWMYCKRYCSDPRIVGLRRRTTLASWLVVGNGVGMGIGPLLGGLFYRYIGFGNSGLTGSIWNGYTSPTWVMAGIWALYWASCFIWFEDVPKNGHVSSPPQHGVEIKERQFTTTAVSVTPPSTSDPVSRHGIPPVSNAPKIQVPSSSPDEEPLPRSHYPVIFCMCWFAMTCFFILGAWEANLPVYTSAEVNPSFSFSPFIAGGFLSVGALICFPFFVLNIFVARRVQDRWILAGGTFLGASALIILLVLLGLNKTAVGGTSTFNTRSVGNDNSTLLSLGTELFSASPNLYTTLTNIRSSSGSGSFNSSILLETETDLGGSVRAFGLTTAPVLFVAWFLVALGFNIASTVTMSLLSKQLPSTQKWNGISSLMIQYSNYLGRVTGAVWGGYGGGIGSLGSSTGTTTMLTADVVRKAMMGYVGLELALVGVGGVLCGCLWRQLKAKTG